MKRIMIVRIAILFAFIFPVRVCLAATKETNRSSLIPQTLAIQKRPYLLQNEFSAHFSYLPLDYFTQYIAFGGSYTHYFSDYFAWEVLNASLAQNQSTGLDGYIRSKGAVTDPFDVMQWYATSNLVYTPMYMKNLFMKDSIVWGDISFVGGYGLANFQTAKSVSTIDAGVMMRFFASDQLSFKLDLRQYFYLAGGLKPNLGITFALSYNFSGFQPKAQVEVEE